MVEEFLTLMADFDDETQAIMSTWYEELQKALPVLMKSFHPILEKITQLYLCAFWPTREIATVELAGKK